MMKKLRGIISDRIRSGELPPDVRVNYTRTVEKPSVKAVKGGSGQGLGQGATRKRSGEKG